MKIPSHPVAAKRHIDRLIGRRDYLIRRAEKETDEEKKGRALAEVSAINSVLSELLSLRTQYEIGNAVRPMGAVVNVEELSAEDIHRLYPHREKPHGETLTEFAIKSATGAEIRISRTKFEDVEKVKVYRWVLDEYDLDKKKMKVASGLAFTVEEFNAVMEILTKIQNSLTDDKD